MTLDDFIDQFSGAPYELSEFASAAEDIEDCEELAQAAKAFLDAQQRFQDLLEAYDVQLG
jgi:hypothetical protein